MLPIQQKMELHNGMDSLTSHRSVVKAIIMEILKHHKTF